MSQVANPVTNPAVRRRSQRVLMQVSVRIRGNDSQNKPFEEETVTLAINAHGALIALKNRITSGSKLKMKHKMTEQEEECHVVFLGPVREGKAEIGLEFSSPCPTFWRVAFPPEDWTPKHPEARTASRARLVEKQDKPEKVEK
ncbi:MAG: PilZ domain-containing protein [Candidatus Acidiferrum sp.]